jgi:hypothetical protein
VRDQSDDQSDHLGRLLQPVKEHPFGRTEGLATCSTDEATFLLVVDTNVALIGLPSGGRSPGSGKIHLLGSAVVFPLYSSWKDCRQTSDFFKERLDHD